MDKHIEKLYKKYQGKVLQDDGAYASKEFKQFASYFKRQVKASAEERGFELHSFSVGHYDVSGFFKKGEKYVYFSYDEPRCQRIDFNRRDALLGILYRTAEGPKDFIGGYNNFASLLDFIDSVEALFNRIA